MRSTSMHLLMAIGLAACTGDKQSTDSADACTDVPLANAGPDVTHAIGSAVTLSGSATESCTDEGMSYTWNFDSIPGGSAVTNASLASNNSEAAVSNNFVPDLPGDYVLSLVAENTNGSSSPDMVVITVSTSDEAPIGDCGGDRSGAVGEAVSMDASASSDDKGAALDYSWSLTSPECSALASANLFNATGPAPSFVPDCDGLYHVGLVVSDGVHWSDPVICTVTVSGSNQAPVADAGDSIDLGSCADNPLYLNGNGSYDLDADPLSFRWSVVSVPGGSAVTDESISDPSIATPTATWDLTGSYTFQLEVSDGAEWSAPDVVTYTISDYDSSSSYPVANAGSSQTVSSEADCESASYVWTCEDCPSIEMDLDGSASTHSEGAPITYHWTESTGDVSFSNRYGVYTSATLPAIAPEYGVATTNSYDVQLSVSDCQQSDNSSVELTYSCTGIKD